MTGQAQRMCKQALLRGDNGASASRAVRTGENERARGGPIPPALTQKEEKRFQWWAWPILISDVWSYPNIVPGLRLLARPGPCHVLRFQYTTDQPSVLDVYSTTTLRLSGAIA